MIIGISGGSGSGKTTVLHILRELGAVVLDCDAVYHQLLQTDPALLSAIETRFPGTVRQGTLDRAALGAVVFSDPQALLDLNRITHGAVKKEVTRRLTPEPKLAAIDAIGLFESGLSELCQLTVAVTAPADIRIQRISQRDGITPEQARARIHAQADQEAFVLRCDYHLENAGTPAEFRDKCLAFFRELGIINP